MAREQIGEYCERVTVNVYSEPQLTLGTTVCNDDTYSVVVNVDLGAWNAILSGASTGIEVTANTGTLLLTTTVGDNIILTNIPMEMNATISIGGGNSGTCEQSITITAPDCTPPECEADSGDW